MSVVGNREYWWGVATGVVLVAAVVGLGFYRARVELERYVERHRAERELELASQVELRVADLPEPGDLAVGRARYDWTLVDLDGHEVAFAELRGRVVLLSFWSRRSLDCHAEMSELRSLVERLAGDDRIAFLLVSDEGLERAREYEGREKTGLPIYAVKGTLPDVFAPGEPPEPSRGFVVGCDGRILLRQSGATRWGDERVAAFLETRADDC